jgi:hypothetical protein
MSEDKNLVSQIQEIFDTNLNIDEINRTPAFTNLMDIIPNSVTVFDSNAPAYILNPYTTGKIKSFTNYDVELNKSATQATLISIDSVSEMVKSKAHALQTLVLYLNNALIELTDTLGTDIVLDRNNKLGVKFNSLKDYAAIEMRVTLIVNKNKE